MARSAMEDFPVYGLLPKRETQVESFLRKYPEYDGDGTLIAIFDSGIDPGAPGLTKTPCGKRKIVDVIDCSGCGDVDTSTCVIINTEDNTINGITGRKLKIPSTWNNPTGKYYVGCKKFFSLFPSTPLRRVKREKKEEEWDPVQKETLAKYCARLVEEENRQGSLPKTEEQRLTLEDAKATVESLKKINEKYDECGPVFDCVVFHDGEEWKACIDTSDDGNLEACDLLSSFKIRGEYARFSDKDMLNYAVTIMDEGQRLSIITNSSSHGTHVASIASAYFEEQPELNGVAPGAQIISMQIGDNRVDGMETGTALIRAMICAIERGVDVINLSYGESSKWTNSGRVIEMMNKIVAEHNVVFLSSAGNNGPALTTVGAPGGTSENVIGVGAYVSPDMMTAEYSLIEKVPGNQYTWSSTGPSSDGSLGVCITAPGGAITSVPNWTLSKSQLMNGTSMSSPNACGGVAVLLSALKKENVTYSPRSIRRSLENTALKVEGLSTLVQGYGLLQVDKAFDYMKEYSKDPLSRFISYKITYGSNKRGIYLREYKDHNIPEKHVVFIKPSFHKQTDNNLKINFNVKLSLVSDQPWVVCPSHVDMNNGERNIAVEIKKDGLKPGVHYSEVHGFDLENVNLGPVFRIPITVIIPENQDRNGTTRAVDIGKLSFKAGSRNRKFYFVPHGATWAELWLSSEDKERDVRYIMHVLQLAPDTAFIENEFFKMVTMKANNSEETKLVFAVKGGSTMELCIARWWNAPGDSELTGRMVFHSVNPNNNHVYLNGNVQFCRVDLVNYLGIETVAPKASLTHHVMPIVPKENAIKPLGPRDLLPEGEQIYSLEMTYNFNLASACEVIPVAPQFHDLLYENKYESQLWMCYDKDKYLIRSGDAFPLKYKYVCKLAKGDHVIKFQIRHSDHASLEALKDMPMNLHIKLAAPISLDAYSSRENLLNKQKKFKEISLAKETLCPVYISTPPDDKLPKALKPGHQLVGTITFAKSTDKCSYPLSMTAAQPKASTDKNKEGKEVKPMEEQYKEAVDEFLGQWLAKVQGTPVEDEIRDKFSNSLAAQDAILNALDGSKERMSKLKEIMDAARIIVKEIDTEMLLSYFGVKTQMNNEEIKKKEKMDKEKSIYVNATYKLGLAISDGLISTNKTETNDVEPDEAAFSLDELNECYKNLAKFVEATDSKMQLLTVRHGLVHKQYGRALKALLAYFEENGYTKEHFNVYIDIVQELGWKHIVEYLKRWLLVRFPASYELF